MKIAITGSTGFVGQNLLKYLNADELKSLSREELNNPNAESLNNCDAIIHLAGKAHDLKKTSNPEEYFQVNYELTKKLYDVFLKSDAKRFIFISSVKAAADSVEGVLTEEVVPNPVTAYGKSKLMAEQYIMSQQLPEEKSYYILRPCMIHGPGNKGNLNLLYQFVKKGIPYPLATFKNERSFLSVENLCFVIQQLLEKNITPGIYHVADDKPLSTEEVVSILATVSGLQARLWPIPKNMIIVLAKIGSLLRLPINTERLNKMIESYIVSNDKIKMAIGADFPLTSKAGLLITATSFHTKHS